MATQISFLCLWGMALTRRACQPRAQARPRWSDRSRERTECRPSWLPPAVRASSSSDGQSRPSPPDHRCQPCCPTEKDKIKPPIDLFLVHTTSRWAICPICPTCTISVSPKWGCADRGAVTKPPLRDFSPLSFLPNILQTDKLVNKASSFEPSQQKKYSTFLERI